MDPILTQGHNRWWTNPAWITFWPDICFRMTQWSQVYAGYPYSTPSLCSSICSPSSTRDQQVSCFARGGWAGGLQSGFAPGPDPGPGNQGFQAARTGSDPGFLGLMLVPKSENYPESRSRSRIFENRSCCIL